MSAPAGVSELPVPRHACPLRAAEAALLLLRTKRPGMAERVLEKLPGLLLRAERERLPAEDEELRGRLEFLEAALAQRRDMQDRLARAAREPADLKAALAAAEPHERARRGAS